MKEKKENKILDEILDYVKTIVITVICCMIFLYFVQISRVVGSSMQPNYYEGNIVLVNKVLYKQSNDPKYNDIVIVKVNEDGENTEIIKRIVGVGGDHIIIHDNTLYRNGKEVTENYIKETMATDDEVDITLGDDEVFCLGDNRNVSLDSRYFGAFDFKEDIVGKVFVKIPL